jgi:hypothetical protein
MNLHFGYQEPYHDCNLRRNLWKKTETKILIKHCMYMYIIFSACLRKWSEKSGCLCQLCSARMHHTPSLWSALELSQTIKIFAQWFLFYPYMTPCKVHVNSIFDRKTKHNDTTLLHFLPNFSQDKSKDITRNVIENKAVAKFQCYHL